MPVGRLLCNMPSSKPLSQEQLDPLIRDWVAGFVKYLDVDVLLKSPLAEVIMNILGRPLSDEAKMNLERIEFVRALFHGYEDEYPLKESVSVTSVAEIGPDTSLGMEIELTWRDASKLRVVGVGRMTITRTETKLTGFYLIEVKEAEPMTDVPERARMLEEGLRKVIVRAIAFLIFEILKKVGRIG
jgi:hypothetical protein